MKEYPRKPAPSETTHLAFDIGNVIFDFDFTPLLEAMARRTGAGLTGVTSFFRRPELADRFERGRMRPEALFDLARTELDMAGTFDEFVVLWNDIFSPHPGMENLIARLPDRVGLHAASNTNVLHQRHLLATYPVFERFDSIVTSCDLGVRKPAPAFYRGLLDRIGGPAEEVLFIDDLQENVEGARKAGFAVHSFEGSEGLEAELRRLGIL